MGLNIKQVKDQISNVEYIYRDMLTVCIITTKNGFHVVGSSSCFSPSEYDRDIGDREAHKEAFNKLCECEAYFQKQPVRFPLTTSPVPTSPGIALYKSTDLIGGA